MIVRLVSGQVSKQYPGKFRVLPPSDLQVSKVSKVSGQYLSLT